MIIFLRTSKVKENTSSSSLLTTRKHNKLLNRTDWTDIKLPATTAKEAKIKYLGSFTGYCFHFLCQKSKIKYYVPDTLNIYPLFIFFLRYSSVAVTGMLLFKKNTLGTRILQLHGSKHKQGNIKQI